MDRKEYIIKREETEGELVAASLFSVSSPVAQHVS